MHVSQYTVVMTYTHKMSAFGDLLELHEQICYVQCSFCTTILLVNVPCSSLSSVVVTVRCGQCTGILSVNMSKACLLPQDLVASSNPLQELDRRQVKRELSPTADMKGVSTAACMSDEDEIEDSIIHTNRVIHKPPEKKQRAPSAYNRFIKEEIKRLKSEHPAMTHKQAFSSAAKNWAHCPQSQHKGREEGNTRAANNNEVHHFGNGCYETKALVGNLLLLDDRPRMNG